MLTLPLLEGVVLLPANRLNHSSRKVNIILADLGDTEILASTSASKISGRLRPICTRGSRLVFPYPNYQVSWDPVPRVVQPLKVKGWTFYTLEIL